MSKSMAITRKVIDDEVNLLKALATQYTEKKGSALQRKADAQLASLDDVISITTDNPMPDVLVTSGVVGEDGEQVSPASVRLGDLAVYVVELTAWAEQAANEAVTSKLKAEGDDNTLDAIKEQFDDKRTFVEALLKVAPAFNVNVDDVELPSLRASRSSGSRPATRRKGKFAHYYRLVNDERIDQPASQDTLSSFAWYQGHKILGNGGKIGSVKAADLEAWLKDHGVDSPMGKAWTVEGADGNTYGMEIVDPATDTSEEE